MFELEIMTAGYTVAVAATSVMICKCINRNQLKKINNEVERLKKAVLDSEAEIKRLKSEKSNQN